MNQGWLEQNKRNYEDVCLLRCRALVQEEASHSLYLRSLTISSDIFCDKYTGYVMLHASASSWNRHEGGSNVRSVACRLCMEVLIEQQVARLVTAHCYYYYKRDLRIIHVNQVDSNYRSSCQVT